MYTFVLPKLPPEMKKLLSLIGVLMLLPFYINAQSSFCPNDPPLNSFLADSPWPIYHRNNYTQASTCIKGPEAGDSLAVKARTNIAGGTSPWVYLTDPYPNGERALLQSNATYIFKFIDDGTEIVAVDSIRIDFDFITSFGWNFLLTKDKIWYTYDPKYDPEEEEFTRLFKIGDVDNQDPYSEMVLLDTFNFGNIGINRTQHFSINYSGQIVFHSENNEAEGYATLGILSPDFEVLDTLNYTTSPGEIVHHNAFPIDENNAMYMVTTERMICFNWDGANLSKAWEAAYDFIADGPTGSFAEGSGTTPTMLGWGEGNDKLVVVADGHNRNNLVAFWREIPTDWEGIPGMDIHFADSIQIPLAVSSNNTFQSIENSPTGFGYDIGIAQYNGFLGYDCENNKGVQKISWDTAANEFYIAWANDSINMNGVLTYSEGSNLVYGSGKELDCNYYYYGLNWETGALEFRQLLGGEGTFLDDPFYDGGNNNIIDENGNIYFPGGASLVKLEIVERATSTSKVGSIEKSFQLSPNPTAQTLRIEFPFGSIEQVVIFDLNGKQVKTWRGGQNTLDVSTLTKGMYMIQVWDGAQSWVEKFVKI